VQRPGRARPHRESITISIFLSPALAKVWGEPEAVAADRLIQLLDDAGIRSAVVLSLAYAWGSPGRAFSHEFVWRYLQLHDFDFSEAAVQPVNSLKSRISPRRSQVAT
jgi:hypothetical protein